MEVKVPKQIGDCGVERCQDFLCKRGCIVCGKPIQLSRPHGWTCEEHDVVEIPYVIRRAKIEAKRRQENASNG